MLVLTRKAGQSVRIGNNIAVVVLEVKGNHVRIGIDAPTQIRIVRQELCATAVGSCVGGELVAREMEHAARNSSPRF